MNCDVGKATEGLGNKLWRRWSDKTFPSLHLRHNLFSNPSVACSVTSPTSQLIPKPFRRFTYVTAYSPTLPLLHLSHSSFSNPSFASPTSQALHLIHLASRPWFCWTFHMHSFTELTVFIAIYLFSNLRGNHSYMKYKIFTSKCDSAYLSLPYTFPLIIVNYVTRI